MKIPISVIENIIMSLGKPLIVKICPRDAMFCGF
jgi:hypothetical protein